MSISLRLGQALCCLASLLLSGCSSPSLVQEHRAVAGLIDLTDWDSAGEPQVSLQGDWEFSWGTQKPGYLAVPGRWTQPGAQAGPLPPNGRAVYRLRALLPPDMPPLALMVREVDRAYSLKINGTEYATGFRVADTEAGEGGPGLSRTFYFLAQDRLDLEFEVSSHWGSWGGGLAYSPVLGTAQTIGWERVYDTALEVFLTGILLIMALYHAMLFALDRRDTSLILFGLVCLAALTRNLVQNEGVLATALGLSDEWIRRWSWGSGYLLCLVYAWFVDRFFRRERARTFLLVLTLVGGLMVLVCLLAPQTLYGSAALLWGYFVVGLAAMLVWILQAIQEKRPFGWLLLAGTLSAGIPGLIDIATNVMGLLPLFIVPFGVLPFLGILSYILAQRYTQGTRDAENLLAHNARLAELDRAKSHFFANISHELKTPLTLLLGPLEGLKQGEYGASLSPQHPVFGVMRTNATRILKLVENLLRIAKMESGAPSQKQPVDLAKTLEGYCEEFRSVALHKGVSLKFRCEDPPAGAVLLDWQDLETVVFNLLSNALKFTPSGGTVVLSLTVKLDRVVLEVADSGIGITAEKQALLFGRFKTIYDRERADYQGTGIGLSIAKETALRMGGDLRVLSEPGRGTTFTADWPCELSEREAALVSIPSSRAKTVLVSDFSVPWYSPDPESNPRAGTKRVLVVEDSEDLRGYLTSLLSRDFQVLSASDGEAALRLLEVEPTVDLILSDIMMPHMDGIAFRDAVQNLPGGSSIPFLFLTARNTDEERLVQLKRGVLDYLPKPFSPEVLRAKITAVLINQEREKRELARRPAPLPHL